MRLCEEYPCKKYDGAGLYDSFITHHNQLKDFEKVKRIGIEAYRAELNRKVLLLQELLENYDDGRRKSYFCLAVNLLDLQDIEFAMTQLELMDRQSAIKEKAAAAVGIFDAIANKRGVSMKLRKSPEREIEIGRKAE